MHRFLICLRLMYRQTVAALLGKYRFLTGAALLGECRFLTWLRAYAHKQAGAALFGEYRDGGGAALLDVQRILRVPTRLCVVRFPAIAMMEVPKGSLRWPDAR